MRFHGYFRSSSSYRCRIAFGLKGLTPDFVPVHLVKDGGQHRTDAYRALNPTGLIPTLETPQGVITETGAILLWLADRHDLAQGADRATLLRWLFFTANTPHADLRQMFYPDQYVPEGAISAHHAILSARMIRHYGLLEAAAQTHPALFAPQGILAPYIACLMRWSVLYPQGQTQWFRLADFPALHDMAKGLEALPQTQRAAAAEGLGPTPFTRPQLANPPEGSAL
jgi:glutathione S-transferase